MAATKPSPVVKWAGGKTSLLTRIAARLPEAYGAYIEPFLGGGAAFFALRPERALVADSNAELIAMYEAIRDEPAALMAALDTLQPHVADRERYLAVRAQDPATLTRVDAAARFIYLNKTCYNGLYRVNREGKFNVPFGRHASPPRLYDAGNLHAVGEALRRADMRCADYRDVLREATPGDFVYLDPPYHPPTRTANFTSYTPLGFGDVDQRALADEVARLTDAGVFVLLSNSDTPLIRELYGRYHATEEAVGRAINSRADRRKGTLELLVDNYEMMPKKSRSQSSRSSKATALPVDKR